MDDAPFKIKEALSIVDVVSEYVELSPSGNTFKGLCPFHTEKTPSFQVSTERNSFYCFGCNKGGDVFTFVQEIESLSFSEVLKKLADKAGITLTPRSGKNNNGGSRSLMDTLTRIHEIASSFYQVQFRKSSLSIDYLKSRGLTKESMILFEVGYALGDWSLLYNYLKSRGFPDSVLLASGLFIQGKKGLYDRFRERVMFPISSHSGSPVGFTGRILLGPGSTQDLTKVGKYVNSPETDLYKKSKVLYGFDKAKRSVLKKKEILVVEGQMDVVMCHQAGLTHTVALSGTALSITQVKLFSRIAKTCVLALDGDTAGKRAALKSIEVLVAEGLDVKLLILPEGKDPADIIKGDVVMFNQLYDNALPFLEWQQLHLRPYALKSIKEKEDVLRKEMYPSLGDNPSPMLLDMAIGLYADALSVSRSTLLEDFDRYQRDKKEVPGAKADASNNLQVEFSSLSEFHPHMTLEAVVLWQGKHVDRYPYIDEVATELSRFLEEYGFAPRRDLDEIGVLADVFAVKFQDLATKDFVEELLLRAKKHLLQEKKRALDQVLISDFLDSAKEIEVMGQITKFSQAIDALHNTD